VWLPISIDAPFMTSLRYLHCRSELQIGTLREEENIHPHQRLAGGGRLVRGTLVRALMLAVLFPLAVNPLAAKDKPPIQYQIPIPPPPDFSAFDWLLGEWTGKTSPNGPAGEVHLAVSSELGNRFLLFRGEISLAGTSTVPAMKESWMGILSPSTNGPGFILRVFSSNGFITRYRVTLDGPELHMNPEGGDSPPPGWLFRESWVRAGPDEITETVQVAPPGKAFFDYYSSRYTRVPPAAKTTPAH